MLFALLRSSLHKQEAELSFCKEATADDWKQCHQIAVAQGVMALAWDGRVLRCKGSNILTIGKSKLHKFQ